MKHHNGSGGSIPACAGEPNREDLYCSEWVVYPRVRGGTHMCREVLKLFEGLSPRARGNHDRVFALLCDARSIPACAGEPDGSAGAGPRQRVYPRVRGGTSVAPLESARSWGLSPRARGNPCRLTTAGGRRRSLPACAGEPRLDRIDGVHQAVYPRVRGGTHMVDRSQRRSGGLSPRARGNLATGNCGPAWLRSIPACAGEPSA